MSFATVIVEFQAKPGQGDALGEALNQAIQNTITKEGCYEAVMVRDDDDPDHFLMYEQWMSAQQHKDYVAALMDSPKMEVFMAMMAGPPQSKYYSAHSAGGGEWGGPQHLELTSDDVEATKTFLTEVFDWQFSPMMENYDGFWAPGAFMGGITPRMEHRPAAETIPYLVVNDLDARLKRVEEAGGEITVPIQVIPEAGRFFWFKAPGGLPLAVWESAQR